MTLSLARVTHIYFGQDYLETLINSNTSENL